MSVPTARVVQPFWSSSGIMSRALRCGYSGICVAARHPQHTHARPPNVTELLALVLFFYVLATVTLGRGSAGRALLLHRLLPMAALALVLCEIGMAAFAAARNGFLCTDPSIHLAVDYQLASESQEGGGGRGSGGSGGKRRLTTTESGDRTLDFDDDEDEDEDEDENLERAPLAPRSSSSSSSHLDGGGGGRKPQSVCFRIKSAFALVAFVPLMRVLFELGALAAAVVNVVKPLSPPRSLSFSSGARRTVNGNSGRRRRRLLCCRSLDYNFGTQDLLPASLVCMKAARKALGICFLTVLLTLILATPHT